MAPAPTAPLSKPHPPRTRLLAASIALVLATVAVVMGLMYCKNLERRYVHALAPEFTDPKLQGVALQKQALAVDDLLVLYGSSELLQDMPTNPSQFFQDYPTGFSVFPIGKPGTTALAVLQRVAAMGPHLRGQKVAYSISPGFFFTEAFDPKYYEGNFSELQAIELAFSRNLSRELKRDVARRMLAYPRTLQDRPLLEYTLEHLARDRPRDHVIHALLWPLGWMQIAVGRVQDHVQVTLHVLSIDERLGEGPRRSKRVLNWTDLLKRAAQFVNVKQMQTKDRELARRRLPKASRAKQVLDTVKHAQEWTDMELLLRTFKELEGRPLLLVMPVEDRRLEIFGATPEARTAFIERLSALARRYQFPLVAFREHEQDPSFTGDFSDHLSGKGWLYYSKALDDFFNERL